MNTNSFNKTKLAASVAIIISAMASSSVLAQENSPSQNAASEPVEEVLVTGIRGSLMRSMDIKRESSGIVDAISAEEMGKFPDTNLAESLQRIPGVSVSRSNGEGSEITVRGFGPEFNLVTLNGRQMPGTGFTRSFQFENLSPEGVSSLVVNKSARAELPSGGLGATVNIVTNKPLDTPGQIFALTGKAIMDTSNKNGDDVTPEIAGIYSNTFMDDTFGIGVTFSHYRRDFQQQEAAISGWQANVGLGDPADTIDARAYDAEGLPVRSYQIPDANGVFPYMFRDSSGELYRAGNGDLIVGTTNADGYVVNDKDELILDQSGDMIPGDNAELAQQDAYFFPKEMGYNFADIEQARTNSQVTLQYKPMDNLVFTLDRTETKAATATERFGWGVWNEFGGNIRGYELDQNGTAIWADIAGNDGSFTARRDTTEVNSLSLGFNADWQANDALHFTFDLHDSYSETDNGADDGTGYAGQVILGSNDLDSKEYDFRTGDIPSFLVNWDNGTNQLPANEIDANFSQFFRSPGKSEIKQAQIHGSWTPDFFEPLDVIKFGLLRSDQTLSGIDGWSGLQGASLQGMEAVLPDDMFTRHDTGDFLDQFEGGGSELSPNYYYTFDYGEAIARLDDYQGNYTQDPYASRKLNKEVNEKINAVYVQADWEFELGGIPTQINTGVRYEETKVTNPSVALVPEQVIWATQSEWITNFVNGEEVAVTYDSKYDFVLPMIDFKFDITDDLVVRASWGQSITRPELNYLLGGLSVSGSPKIGARKASGGNPYLDPYKSTNIDLSFEYYYDDDSFVSAGIFSKKVDGWIESGTRQDTIDGIYDIFQGQRWNTADANLGGNAEYSDIWDEMINLGYEVYDDDGNPYFEPDPNTDNLMVWTFDSPVNAADVRETKGLELIVQHMFGDSGFGTAVNATFVEGNVEVDPYILTSQKALPGLSDSANFQAFYEKDGLSVKLVYAWRDSYLIGQGQSQGTVDTPPQNHKAYGQWDASINYDINDNFTVFVDGVNLNNATEEGYGRFEEQFLFARQYGPRYTVGARYNF